MRLSWNTLNDNKWEFKQDSFVIATIFHKPNGKFSLWVKLPDVFKKIKTMIVDTYLFDSFEEAENGFLKILDENVTPWCESVLKIKDTQ